ncbi:RICIN domain-containing protein [Nonomuraea jiangxiensis]|uniref:Glycosyl hydrolases family 43 n=1 Tax=Nonomuraea jiangxiensis TaxID=633440 RepID=A0A1G9RFJ3_9ACTN|nr:RICIN domain-containing protein [Nonomuraea jiangxiensis]SDM22082.1 Glycosyl hydrolases family 43 [Nonomuraea jiangxiensis]
MALQRDGRTFVIYSASACWGPDYKLEQLTYNGGNPLSASSWVKRPTPVFQRSGNVYGPGHNGFFTSPNGAESWIIYHAGGGCDNNRNSGKCLEVAGGATADGTNIRQWTCSGGAGQRWRVEEQADDTSRLVNVATGKVADVADCGTADVRQSWLNSTCQQWFIRPV